MENYKILLIEDSPTQAVFLGDMLEEQGWQVIYVASGEMALDHLTTDLPDLILLDYHLPGIQGDEVCRRLRMNISTRDLFIIILTSESNILTTKKLLEIGADDYILKNFSEEILIPKIKSMFRKIKTKQSSDHLFQQGTLLAIDDSPTYLEFLSEIMQKEGYQIDKTDNPKKIFDEEFIEKYDCLLVDLKMPDVDGIEICRYIAESKSEKKSSPMILILTEHDSPKEMLQVLEAGADDFISKSSNVSVIKSRIRAALRRKFIQEQLKNKQLEEERALLEKESAHAKAELIEQLQSTVKILEKTKRKAEEASKFKSRFLANMSHEIRTPLNAILGFTELLLEEEQEEAKIDSLQAIKRSGDHLLEVINDILDLSKIEAGKIEISERGIDIKSFMNLVYKLFELDFKEKKLKFSIKIPENFPKYIVGDDFRIKQMLVNLINNALKFTEKGEVIVALSQEDKYMYVKVIDSGIGIEKESLEKIFSPFQQASKDTTRNYGGTGLGLSISKGLIELMDGSLSVISNDKGSVFTLKIPFKEVDTKQMETSIDGEQLVQQWLPQDEDLRALTLEYITKLPEYIGTIDQAFGDRDVEELSQIVHKFKGNSGSFELQEFFEILVLLEEEIKASCDWDKIGKLRQQIHALLEKIPKKYLPETAVQQKQPKKELKVLVAEDDLMNQKLIKLILQKNKIKCDIANNGQIALEMMQENQYDLLLLDMQMPVMDGLQTINHIRNAPQFKNIYVIALTASALKGDEEKYKEAGCDDYLTKPIDKTLLLEKLNSKTV